MTVLALSVCIICGNTICMINRIHDGCKKQHRPLIKMTKWPYSKDPFLVIITDMADNALTMKTTD